MAASTFRLPRVPKQPTALNALFRNLVSVREQTWGAPGSPHYAHSNEVLATDRLFSSVLHVGTNLFHKSFPPTLLGAFSFFFFFSFAALLKSALSDARPQSDHLQFDLLILSFLLCSAKTNCGRFHFCY